MGIEVADIPYDRSKPGASVRLLYHYPLRNVQNFSIVTMKVTFPPGGASPPHRHGGASVAAILTKGTIYNKMNNEPTRKLEQWESWYEAPGCHHKTSANASETEPAEFIATFVVETKIVVEEPHKLVQVDEEYKDIPITVES